MVAFDMFAGVGWGVGARELGVEEEGIEIMPESVATRDAFGLKTVHDDVWTYDYKLGAHEGHKASPPCQTFSLAGKGSGRKALDDVLSIIRSGAWRDKDRLREAGKILGDDRSSLVLMPLHAAYAEMPEWLAWEQVPTVQPVWDACSFVLQEMGYSVWTGRMQAEQYGVPQTRKRSILIASRVRGVTMPKPTHSKYYPRSPKKLDEGVEKWMSMAEALGWDGEWALRSNYGTGGDPALRGERLLEEPAATVTSKIDRAKWQFAGAGRTAVDPAGQVRRDLDEPAHTITGKGTAAWCYERPATVVQGDPRLAAPGHRCMTKDCHPGREPESMFNSAVRVQVHEAGLLQSFPADMPWQGSKSKQYLQVGNAVPPGLAIPVLGEAAGLDWQEANETYRGKVFGK